MHSVERFRRISSGDLSPRILCIRPTPPSSTSRHPVAACVYGLHFLFFVHACAFLRTRTRSCTLARVLAHTRSCAHARTANSPRPHGLFTALVEPLLTSCLTAGDSSTFWRIELLHLDAKVDMMEVAALVVFL